MSIVIDYDKWGFWLGVLGLLTIPLNILTPKLTSWWSMRARRAARKRLIKLQRRERWLAKRSPERDFYFLIRAAYTCFAMFAGMVALGLIILISRTTSGLGPIGRLGAALDYWGFLAVVLATILSLTAVSVLIDRKTVVGLWEVRDEITRLKRFLGEPDDSGSSREAQPIQ